MAHETDDLTRLHRVPCLHGAGVHVVVSGDEAVAVVDLDPIPTAPGVPTSSLNEAGVGRVDARALRSREVLAPMELARLARQGVDPVAEG